MLNFRQFSVKVMARWLLALGAAVLSGFWVLSIAANPVHTPPGHARFYPQVVDTSAGYPGSTTFYMPGDVVQWNGLVDPPPIPLPQWRDHRIDFPDGGQAYKAGSIQYPYGYRVSYQVGGKWSTKEPEDNVRVSAIRFRFDPIRGSIRPLPPDSSSIYNTGDGYEAKIHHGKVYFVNHHALGKGMKCFDKVLGEPCEDWENGRNLYAQSASQNTSSLVGGEFIYPAYYAGSKVGFECYDVDMDIECGRVMVGDGQSSADIMGMGVAGGKLYAVVTRTGKVACVEVSGRHRTCDFLGGKKGDYQLPGFVGSGYGGGAVAGKYLFIYDVNNSLYCFDDSARAPCAGAWPVPSKTRLPPVGPRIITDTGGRFKAVCAQANECYDELGAEYTKTDLEAGIPVYSAATGKASRELTYRGRMYSFRNDEVECFDFATGASCAGFKFTKAAGQRAYTIVPDTERSDCLWVSTDKGVAHSFSAIDGKPCSASAGPFKVIAKPLNGARCVPLKITPKWSALLISKPATFPIDVVFKDFLTDAVVKKGVIPIGKTGMLINDISFADHPELVAELTTVVEGEEKQVFTAEIRSNITTEQFCMQSTTPNSGCGIAGDWTSKTGLTGEFTPNWQTTIKGKGLTGNAALEGDNAGAAVSSNELAQSPLVFRGRYNERQLSGDLWVSRLSSVTGQAGNTLSKLTDVGNIEGPASRNILTQLPNNGSTEGQTIPLRWEQLDETQKFTLGKGLWRVDDGLGPNRLNYLRGSREDEAPTYKEIPTGKLRKRYRVMGMVLDASAVYVPTRMVQSLSEGKAPGYENFLLNPPRKDNMVFVAANDGFLHGVVVQDKGGTDVTLKEQFAYMPRRLLKEMARYTDGTPTEMWVDPYFFDATPMVNDIYRNKAWSTILAAPFGRGAPGLVVLDITKGDVVTEGNKQLVVREFSDEDDADMGRIVTPPALNYVNYATQIVKIRQGDRTRPAVVVGNGIQSANGLAALFVIYIDAQGGYTKLMAPSSAADNGLSTPRLMDLDGDGVVDRAYAGDVAGNLWTFDLTDVSRNAIPKLLTKAVNSINTAPVARHFAPAGTCRHCNMVNVVTGKPGLGPLQFDFNPGINAAYGLWDRNSSSSIEMTDLVSQDVTVLASGEWTVERRNLNYVNNDSSIRGWMMPLSDGYMNVANPVLRNGSEFEFYPFLKPGTSGNSCKIPTGTLVSLNNKTGNPVGSGDTVGWLTSTPAYGKMPEVAVTGKDKVQLIERNGKTVMRDRLLPITQRISWQELQRGSVNGSKDENALGVHLN